MTLKHTRWPGVPALHLEQSRGSLKGTLWKRSIAPVSFEAATVACHSSYVQNHFQDCLTARANTISAAQGLAQEWIQHKQQANSRPDFGTDATGRHVPVGGNGGGQQAMQVNLAARSAESGQLAAQQQQEQLQRHTTQPQRPQPQQHKGFKQQQQQQPSKEVSTANGDQQQQQQQQGTKNVRPGQEVTAQNSKRAQCKDGRLKRNSKPGGKPMYQQVEEKFKVSNVTQSKWPARISGSFAWQVSFCSMLRCTSCVARDILDMLFTQDVQFARPPTPWTPGRCLERSLRRGHQGLQMQQVLMYRVAY